jgi:hypothetical protein
MPPPVQGGGHTSSSPAPWEALCSWEKEGTPPADYQDLKNFRCPGFQDSESGSMGGITPEYKQMHELARGIALATFALPCG